MRLSHITKMVSGLVTKYLVVRAFKPDGYVAGYKVVCENDCSRLVGIASTWEELGKIELEFRHRLGPHWSSYYFTVIRGVDAKEYEYAGTSDFEVGEPLFRSECSSCRAPFWDAEPGVRLVACSLCPVAA